MSCCARLRGEPRRDGPRFFARFATGFLRAPLAGFFEVPSLVPAFSGDDDARGRRDFAMGMTFFGGRMQIRFAKVRPDTLRSGILRASVALYATGTKECQRSENRPAARIERRAPPDFRECGTADESLRHQSSTERAASETPVSEAAAPVRGHPGTARAQPRPDTAERYFASTVTPGKSSVRNGVSGSPAALNMLTTGLSAHP